MNNIHILPEIVANKIAAGEVVERPASIVKELIENSLDAEATRIDVRIDHGGKSLIRVADNGSGMTRADAERALQRHATSKIQNAEDLETIRTFGFRGEALPSIAAVSRLRLRTRSRGSEQGTEIVFEGGGLRSIADCSCGEGTIVEVRDLFFNTPARRKFMRGDSTERAHIFNGVANFGLAKTQVQLSLHSGDKKVWDFTPEQNLLTRAVEAFGVQQAEDLLAFSDENGSFRVSGLIGKPQVARANRAGQIFFVNQRGVKAISLSFALQDGFHGLLMHGQYPVAVVFIEVDPSEVDVNVHPTKQEVRLSNERLVKSLLKRAVAARLSQEDEMVPFLNVDRGASFVNRSQQVADTRYTMHDAQKSENQAWNPTKIPIFNMPTQQRTLSEPISLRNQLHITKILGQVHRTYIVAETETGLMLIDQHAAHERVMFEELLKGFQSGQPQRQGMLLNDVLSLRPGQEDLLKEALPSLEKLGFELDRFGENEYVVRAVPATLQDADPVTSLTRFLEQREAGKLITDLEKHPEEMAALIACKRKSVKAQDPMSSEAMQALLERLAACDNPFNCPHGRPACFQMTLDDLEKQFKRKV